VELEKKITTDYIVRLHGHGMVRGIRDRRLGIGITVRGIKIDEMDQDQAFWDHGSKY